MPKKDGITYPDDFMTILNDRWLGPMMRDYLDKKMCAEIYVFLDTIAKKEDPKSQFKTFFADNAKHHVNAPSDSLTTAKKLGAAKDWKSKEWKKVYSEAKDACIRLGNGDPASDFYRDHAGFKEHHLSMLEKQMLRKNYPALLKELAVTDKKGVANVAAMLKADKNKGTRTAKAFTKKNKISMKPAEVIKKIKKTFKIN